MVTVAQPGPLSGTHFLTKLRHTMDHVPAAFSMPFLYVVSSRLVWWWSHLVLPGTLVLCCAVLCCVESSG